jgi:hypothetical protein
MVVKSVSFLRLPKIFSGHFRPLQARRDAYWISMSVVISPKIHLQVGMGQHRPSRDDTIIFERWRKVYRVYGKHSVVRSDPACPMYDLSDDYVSCIIQYYTKSSFSWICQKLAACQSRGYGSSIVVKKHLPGRSPPTKLGRTPCGASSLRPSASVGETEENGPPPPRQ